MCNETLIGMAMAGTGAMMNSRSQAAVIKKQNASSSAAFEASDILRVAELERQDALGEQSKDVWRENLETKSVANQIDQQDAERQRVEQLYTENIADATTNNALLSGQQNAGTNFQEVAARTLAEVSRDTRQRLNALARLHSYGGSDKLNEYAAVNTNRGIGTINNYRQGSLGATNLGRRAILNSPGQVTPGDTFVGDALQGGGSALAFAGGTGQEIVWPWEFDPFGRKLPGRAGGVGTYGVDSRFTSTPTTPAPPAAFFNMFN